MQSMTGYGRAMTARNGRELLLEIKTVNHRFLDIAMRLPRSLSFLEEPLRAILTASALERGHVELSVTYQNHRQDARAVQIDSELVAACQRALTQTAEHCHKQDDTRLYELVNLCQALSITESPEDISAVTDLAQEALGTALGTLLDMRRAEGAAMRRDLMQNLALAEQEVSQIAVLAPQVPLAYRERLTEQLRQWDVQADAARIAQEVALLADRCAIDEELSRFGSHIAQFRQALELDGGVGRKLDFLLQEMNREINTMGSKCQNAVIAAHVVETKCLLEKLREQVQNVV